MKTEDQPISMNIAIGTCNCYTEWFYRSPAGCPEHGVHPYGYIAPSVTADNSLIPINAICIIEGTE